MHVMNISNGERLVLLKLVNIEIKESTNGKKITVGRLSNLYELKNKLKTQSDTHI